MLKDPATPLAGENLQLIIASYSWAFLLFWRSSLIIKYSPRREEGTKITSEGSLEITCSTLLFYPNKDRGPENVTVPRPLGSEGQNSGPQLSSLMSVHST